MKHLSNPPPKRLLRSRTDKVIAGVCGGIARYFGIDSTWIRLLFIVFLLAGGSAILVYIIMWIIMPLDAM